MKVTKRQHMLLNEAARRWLMGMPVKGRDYTGKSLIEAWTGLGSATDYKPVLDAGLMVYVSGPNRGFMAWFKLTEAGAEYVRILLDLEELGWREIP